MPSALTGRPGDDVEAVVAMLLCRRFERAARRRPGQGDRGVDVFVPLADGRRDVYQVKKFDQSLTSSQWAQVRGSYETLVQAAAEDEQLKVRNWYLVVLVDATDADEAKLAEITADSPFELCEWKGLAWVDALASEYPEVVDYYLHDGKARLERTHRDLMTVLGMRGDAEDGAAAAVGAGLTALHRTLNEQDPWYRYDFAVGAATDPQAMIPAQLPVSLVLILQVWEGDQCVTWQIHALCDESVRERPIPIDVQFDVSAYPELAESLRLMAEYGKPFDAPEGSVAIAVDLPGGFGTNKGKGSLTVGQSVGDKARQYALRLRAASPEAEAEPVTVRLEMNAPTVGSRGARVSGQHDGGAFTFEGLHDFEPPVAHRCHFAPLEPTGKPVASVIDGYEFLRLALAGAPLQIAGEHGPFAPFTDGVAGNDPDGALSDASISLLTALRSLNEIQRHTSTTVLVPDLSTVSRRQAHDWNVAARILAGETVADPSIETVRWDLEALPEQLREGDHAVQFTTDLVVHVGHQRLDLGQQTFRSQAAAVRPDPDAPGRLTITPHPGQSWTRFRTPAPSPTGPDGRHSAAGTNDSP